MTFTNVLLLTTGFCSSTVVPAVGLFVNLPTCIHLIFVAGYPVSVLVHDDILYIDSSVAHDHHRGNSRNNILNTLIMRRMPAFCTG